MFLVSPCCVHRDRRPDPKVSVVPSPRFVLFVFSSVLFVPVFCPSRQASPHAASPHARRSREFTPPFAALPSRGSWESTPPFAALPSRGSRDFTPPFAAQPSRRSREFTPPFADQPAHSSQEMTPPSTLTLAYRPAADSMPAGLPLTQCPPACLWRNARRPASDSMPRRPASDSSPPDCRWLKLAGLPLTQARRIAADSSSPDCRWLMPAGRRWQGKPTRSSVHAAVCGSPTPPFAGDHAAVRGESQPTVGGCLYFAGKANLPSAVHSARSRLRLPPARRPLRWVVKPAGCCRYCQAGRLWSRQPAAAEFDKPAGRGRIWPVSDHGLFNCFCAFSPGGLLIPLSFPKEILGGGSRAPAEETEVGAGAAVSEAVPPWPPELPAPPWPPELPAPPGPRSVCSTLEAPSCVCICVGPVGSPECPPPLPGSTVTARDVPSGRGELC